ncbi:hypothetical protein ACTG2S_08295 [Aeromonas sp. 82P]|uniref:hypothetical protein n=1 Tax=Aeromonas sp. 82P TaxID=3452726 RepID=UPI003F7A11E9
MGFLHSDDLLAYPEAIADLVNVFNIGEYDAVYADLEYVQQNDISKVVRLWQSGNYNKKKLKYGWMPAHPTFYMRRSCYQKFDDFDLSYKIAADYDSILRYLWRANVRAGYLPQVLIKMRVGGISNRSLSTILRKMREDIQAMRNNGLFWPVTLAWKNLSKIPQFLVKNND